jgi:ABC-type phosphate transport system substrate-binding protein
MTFSLIPILRRCRAGLLGLVLVTALGTAAGVEVVVNPGVAVSSLSTAMVRAIFAMKLQQWPDGTPIRVFVQSDDSAEHQALCKQVLDLYPYQMRDAWNRLVFTGTGQAPLKVGSSEEMSKRVAETPGAIGYLMKVEKHDAVHAISIR